MTFHITGLFKDVRIRFLRARCFFRCSCENSGFEHVSFIVNNICARFVFPLSAPKMNVVKKRGWFSEINLFRQYFPHWIDVLFLASQFYVVRVHTKELPFSRFTSKDSQLGTFFPTVLQENVLELPFPQQSCQRMTVQISLKRVFHTGPRFWPFVSW